MAEGLTRAVWEKWDGKLYNWALCGFANGIQRATVKARKAYDDAEHWTFYVDRKPGTQGGQASTHDDAEPPGLTVDGLDTDSLVVRLPAEQHEAVVANWAMTGPLEYRASAIGCHVNTLRNRTKAAVLALEALDIDRRQPQRRVTSIEKRASGIVITRSQYAPVIDGD